MLPGDVEVVLIQEPAALTQLQIAKCDNRRAGTRLPRAVPHRVNDELVKVYAFPSHRDLKDAMKLA